MVKITLSFLQCDMAMAAALYDPVEELTNCFSSQITLDAESETQITVCTWNIMGKARAEPRKMVTTDTFQYPYRIYRAFPTQSISLAQSDIICVQEMIFNPSGARGTARCYLPFAGHYGVVQSKEPTVNYNAVFYNKEKFSEVLLPNQAYHLMEIKRKYYDKILHGGVNIIMRANNGCLRELSDSEVQRIEGCVEKYSMNAFVTDFIGAYQSIALLMRWKQEIHLTY